MSRKKSDPPRIAVVGCGHWGKNLVRNFHEIGHLTHVCDATASGRQTASSLAPDLEIVADFDCLLSKDIDAVVLATPAETHYRLCRQALVAGKDVFVEKPMALQYQDAADLVRVAADRHRILMVGHVLEYHPAIRKLHDLVHDGAIGKVRYVYSNRLNLGKVRTEENILWSFAPHDIAIILRLLAAAPFQVVCCGGAYLQPNIADVTVTHLLFDNGVRAHIHVSWLHPFKEQRLVVVGSRRMLTFDDVKRELVMHDQRVEAREHGPVVVKGDGEAIAFGSDEPLRLECMAFSEAIRTRNQPLTDGSSGLRALGVLEAAQRSLITNGQPIMLDARTGMAPAA